MARLDPERRSPRTPRPPLPGGDRRTPGALVKYPRLHLPFLPGLLAVHTEPQCDPGGGEGVPWLKTPPTEAAKVRKPGGWGRSRPAHGPPNPHRPVAVKPGTHPLTPSLTSPAVEWGCSGRTLCRAGVGFRDDVWEPCGTLGNQGCPAQFCLRCGLAKGRRQEPQ